MKFKDAIKIVRQELNKDKEPGSLWHTYQANIAMTLYDSSNLNTESCNKLANNIMEHIFNEPQIKKESHG